MVGVSRVTQSMISQSALNGLQVNLSRNQQLQQQLSSGKLVQRPSDDPVATVSSMQLRAQKANDDQYLRNIDDASGRLNTADSALQSVSTLVRRAKELMVSSQNGSLTDAGREANATELESIKKSVVDAYNSQWLDRPVFGGTVAGREAIDDSGAYVGNEAPVSARISRDVTLRTDVSGTGAGAGSLPALLDQAISSIRSNDDSAMQANQTGLDGELNKVLDTLGSVGARAAQLDTTKNAITAEQLDFTSRISQNEDVDLPKAIMDLQASQTAYQAAAQSAGKVLQTSLLDYLR